MVVVDIQGVDDFYTDPVIHVVGSEMGNNYFKFVHLFF
jgi:hypothetical protein